MKQIKIVCTIEVGEAMSTQYRLWIAERVRDEIAGAVEDDRDRERDFDYIGTEVRP